MLRHKELGVLHSEMSDLAEKNATALSRCVATARELLELVGGAEPKVPNVELLISRFINTARRQMSTEVMLPSSTFGSSLAPKNITDTELQLRECITHLETGARGKPMRESLSRLVQLHRSLMFSQLQAGVWIGEPALTEAIQIAAKAEIPEVSGMIRRAEDAATKAEDYARRARNALAGSGVALNAERFDNAEKRHALAARIWLAATALLFLFAVRVSWGLLNAGVELDTGAPGPFVSRFLLVSMLLSGAVWCSRSYRAATHNRVLNEHRKNAISTFQLFADGSPDEDTTAAVVLQASAAAFGQQPTGFGPKEDKGGADHLLTTLLQESLRKARG